MSILSGSQAAQQQQQAPEIEDRGRTRFKLEGDNRLVEVDSILTTAIIWATLPECNNPKWQTREIGEMVLALFLFT